MVLVKEKNILTLLLSLLKIKYTKSFSDKLYNEHPYKDNLLGLSKMLSKYGIESSGLKLDAKKENIQYIDVPVVSIYNNQFIVIYKITPNKIYFIHNREKKEKKIEDFLKNWTNLVLIVESDENSIEPDYQKHIKEDLFIKGQNVLLIFSCILFGSILYINNQLFNNLWISSLIILNIIGSYVGYLLVLKQLHVQNTYVDKICISLKNGNCNSVLDSSASKLFGIFSWSEIGLSYFISNLFLLLLFPRLAIFVVFINMCALPYSIWSVWYQKIIVKQWCLLCLIVQVLLWTIFVFNLSFRCLLVPTANFSEILLVCSVYSILLIISHIFISKSGADRVNKEIVQKINCLKMEEGIFSRLLNAQPYYPVDKSVSKILFGNMQANMLITIVTNPYCKECALMHKRVNDLVERLKDKICVQYIISSFSPSLEFTEKFLIGVYLSNEPIQAKNIFYRWFEKGRSQTMKFIKFYNINIESKDIRDEFEKHKMWLSRTQIRGTPTILVNGYKLPDYYKIEDLELLLI